MALNTTDNPLGRVFNNKKAWSNPFITGTLLCRPAA